MGNSPPLDAIRIEHVRENDNSQQIVDIRPADNGQYVHVRRAHSFKSQMKRLIRMNV